MHDSSLIIFPVDSEESRNIPTDWLAFVDHESGVRIHPDKFYSFPDSGGVMCESFSREETLRQVHIHLSQFGHRPEEFDDLVTIEPSELGDYAQMVCTGREFVSRLSDICSHDYTTLTSIYGSFVLNQPKGQS